MVRGLRAQIGALAIFDSPSMCFELTIRKRCYCRNKQFQTNVHKSNNCETKKDAFKRHLKKQKALGKLVELDLNVSAPLNKKRKLEKPEILDKGKHQNAHGQQSRQLKYYHRNKNSMLAEKRQAHLREKKQRLKPFQLSKSKRCWCKDSHKNPAFEISFESFWCIRCIGDCCNVQKE